jgi:hypothetical protein
MSMYTMATFVAVPVNSDTVFAASGPYLENIYINTVLQYNGPNED